MSNVTGIVKAKSANKFGFGIMVNDKWYNSKYEITCNKGDEVSFDDGGKAYVKDLSIVSAGKGAAAVSTASAAGKAVAGGGYSRGVFPVPGNDGSRSIIRQNSITNATVPVTTMISNKMIKESDSLVSTIIGIAREFEKYSSGDIDVELQKVIEDTFQVS